MLKKTHRHFQAPLWRQFCMVNIMTHLRTIKDPFLSTTSTVPPEPLASRKKVRATVLLPSWLVLLSYRVLPYSPVQITSPRSVENSTGFTAALSVSGSKFVNGTCPLFGLLALPVQEWNPAALKRHPRTWPLFLRWKSSKADSGIRDGESDPGCS